VEGRERGDRRGMEAEEERDEISSCRLIITYLKKKNT